MAKREYVLDKFYVGLVDENQFAKLAIEGNACTQVKNFVWIPTGGMRQRAGYYKLNQNSFHNHRIKAVKQVSDPYNVLHSLVFSSLPSASEEVSEIATIISSGASYEFSDLTVPDFWKVRDEHAISFTTVGNSAVFTYSDNDGPLCTWSPGETEVTYLSNSPSGACVVCGFGNYLFVANFVDEGVQRTSRVRWSSANNINEWPEDYYIDIDPFDGDQITGMCVFKDKLLVFKRFRTFAIYWVGGDLLFKVTTISDIGGCLNPNAFCVFQDAVYFIGNFTFYRYKGQGIPEPIGFQIQPLIDNMNMEVRNKFEVESFDPDNLVYFRFASGSEQEANTWICYDPRSDAFTQFEFPIDVSTIAGLDTQEFIRYKHLGLTYGEYFLRIRDMLGTAYGELVLGTTDGFLYSYGYVTNDESQPVQTEWVSKWIDCGLPKLNKRMYNITVFVEKINPNATFSLECYTDWDELTPVFSTEVELNRDEDTEEKRIDITFPFRVIKIKLKTSQLNQIITFHKIILTYLVKSEEHQRETLAKEYFS